MRTFHKGQIVLVSGLLKYNHHKRQAELDTELLCLDRIEVIKYYQKHMLQAYLSTFYFGILLGICFSFVNRNQTDYYTQSENVKSRTEK